MSDPHENLPQRIRELKDVIRNCTLCPWHCHVDRTAGEIGACRTGANPIVASAGPHFGEEPVLVGSGGSGTIFLAGCNLHCVYCQNCDISQEVFGEEITAEELAEQALALQRRGCVNVNFVTPSHVAHAVAEAIARARADGLAVPVVWNSGGYDRVETLQAVEGLVDVYMPDYKYDSNQAGETYSGVSDYADIAREAVAEMYRQVGPLQIERGVARRGLLVRHLVLPGDLAGSRGVLDTLADIAPGCTVHVMGQYRPAFRAAHFPELMRCPSRGEIAELRRYAEGKGLVPVQ